MKRHTQQQGMTLIELVVSIVIISIAAISMLALLSSQASHSGDAMVQTQAVHIADAYLAEVLQQSYQPLANAAGRSNLNDVDDYKTWNDAVAKDRSGNPVPGLSAFSVSITVTPAALGAVPASQSKQVDVIVRHTSGTTVKMTGFRTQHP